MIAGAGIIGLSIALELHRRGARVAVIESGKALRQASIAAAGMLAAEDPHNPAALLPLSRYSLSLYPAFLSEIEALSGLQIPFQTSETFQYSPGSSAHRIAEQSIDPRQLAVALLAAVRAAGIDLREDTPLASSQRWSGKTLILTAGAWSGTLDPDMPITPRKGQMLRVQIPEGLQLREVHRNEDIYIVPRIHGPQAGSALIGATVEDVGFDVTTSNADLAHLRQLAAALVPALASDSKAPTLEAWAGLRPATPDHLPVIGHLGDTLIASGHFRNGILLAPATAMVVADMVLHGPAGMPSAQPRDLDLSPLSPHRFARAPSPDNKLRQSDDAADIRPSIHDNHGSHLR